PGLSSTRRISISLQFLSAIPSVDCNRIGWKGKAESRTLALLGLHPDLPSVALDDFLAHRKAQAGAGDFLLTRETLKNHENLLMKLRINPHPVVANREGPLPIALLR